jgi:hypothetical protein
MEETTPILAQPHKGRVLYLSTPGVLSTVWLVSPQPRTFVAVGEMMKTTTFGSPEFWPEAQQGGGGLLGVFLPRCTSTKISACERSLQCFCFSSSRLKVLLRCQLSISNTKKQLSEKQPVPQSIPPKGALRHWGLRSCTLHFPFFIPTTMGFTKLHQ